MNKGNSSTASGFTIVELLVVIVVIGVLATITIVSFNGISQRAVAASLQSDLENASKQLKLDLVINSAYPTSLALANNNQGIPASSGNTYKYFVDKNSNPQNFCLVSINDSTNTSYKLTNDSAPTSGDCSDYMLKTGLDVGDPLSYPGSGTSWADTSGGNNNATLFNDVGYDSANEGALVFDGVNDYGIINNNFIVSPASLTISGWFSKTSSNSTYNCVLHKGSDTSIGASEYWLGVELNGKLTATIGSRTGVGWAAGQTNIDATLGSWWNLVATWDGSVVRVYVNGQFNKQYNLVNYSNINAPTRIGTSGTGSNYQFPGKISNARVYNRALPASEILENYDSLKVRYGL